MRRKLVNLLFTLGLSFVFITLFKPSAPAITYFPPNESLKFTSAETRLTFLEKQPDQSPKISWTSKSTSDQNVYLRQDASLLFQNGFLKGIVSRWKEHASLIELKQQLDHQKNSQYTSISIHHGEKHEGENKITSLQTMSTDTLYVYRTKGSFHAFNSPATPQEAQWKKQLDLAVQKDLLYHWNDLARHFKIQLEHYSTIPLADLARYEHEPLPDLDQRKTDEVIGKLWEGLYKNYIVQAATGTKSPSRMPLILLDKKNTHLIVLYELNGKKEKLLQRI